MELHGGIGNNRLKTVYPPKLRSGCSTIMEKNMKWIDVNEKLPAVGEKCWYFFDGVGIHRGFYGGLYVDEEGNEWKGMSIFYNDTGFLTGDVTHWHPDQDEKPYW